MSERWRANKACFKLSDPPAKPWAASAPELAWAGAEAGGLARLVGVRHEEKVGRGDRATMSLRRECPGAAGGVEKRAALLLLSTSPRPNGFSLSPTKMGLFPPLGRGEGLR
eukprot:scaffold6809_cov130-Isochrysis_galbana.AAC.2